MVLLVLVLRLYEDTARPIAGSRRPDIKVGRRNCQIENTTNRHQNEVRYCKMMAQLEAVHYEAPSLRRPWSE